MKSSLIILTLFFFSLSTEAQCIYERYRDSIFDQIEVQYNVSYGSAPLWYFPFPNENLQMDIYQPMGDTLDLRPAIIWVHSGGFLDGDKQVNDMVALSENFAKKGYVCTSINYRLGFNVLSNSSAQRAVYRGVQDTRAAYRYLVENAQTLNIDTTKIFVAGSSAGGFATLHLGYLDDDERPSSTFDFPNLGCIDCTGNSFDHEVNPLGLISLWGAIGDTSWIDADEDIALYMAHGTIDDVVPYDSGPPFGFFIFDDVYGSLPVSQRLENVGLSSELTTVIDGEHEPHGTSNGDFIDGPTEFWYQMNDEITTFCLDLFVPESPAIPTEYLICQGDTLVIDLPIVPESYCYKGSAAANIINDQISLVYDSSGVYLDSLCLENEVGALSEPLIFQVTMLLGGCLDETACNYDPLAACDNNSCEFTSCVPCPIDVVPDGMINILDLLAISSDFGCSSDCTADANQDGMVNILDLILISSNFGLPCP